MAAQRRLSQRRLYQGSTRARHRVAPGPQERPAPPPAGPARGHPRHQPTDPLTHRGAHRLEHDHGQLSEKPLPRGGTHERPEPVCGDRLQPRADGQTLARTTGNGANHPTRSPHLLFKITQRMTVTSNRVVFQQPVNVTFLLDGPPPVLRISPPAIDAASAV